MAAMIKQFIEPNLLLYRSTTSDTQLLAEELGFSFQLLDVYDESHPLARESRWCYDPFEPGFIAVLTKKG